MQETSQGLAITQHGLSKIAGLAMSGVACLPNGPLEIPIGLADMRRYKEGARKVQGRLGAADTWAKFNKFSKNLVFPKRFGMIWGPESEITHKTLSQIMISMILILFRKLFLRSRPLNLAHLSADLRDLKNQLRKKWKSSKS